MDTYGYAYVAGNTNSYDFPIRHAWKSDLGGSSDAFVAKFSQNGEKLVYSTHLGGGGGEAAYAIAVDSLGYAYVTGNTNSKNFPNRHALQSALQGATDAFVAKLNSAGNALAYSTYLGGSGDETGYGIAMGDHGRAYVTGETNSFDFPTTLNAFQSGFYSGQSDAFVAKLGPKGGGLAYSTYLGGLGNETGYGIAVGLKGGFMWPGKQLRATFQLPRMPCSRTTAAAMMPS